MPFDSKKSPALISQKFCSKLLQNTRTRKPIRTHMHTHNFTPTHTHPHSHTHTPTHTLTHTHPHLHTHAHTHTRTHTHSHTHAHAPMFSAQLEIQTQLSEKAESYLSKKNLLKNNFFSLSTIFFVHLMQNSESMQWCSGHCPGIKTMRMKKNRQNLRP